MYLEAHAEREGQCDNHDDPGHCGEQPATQANAHVIQLVNWKGKKCRWWSKLSFWQVKVISAAATAAARFERKQITEVWEGLKPFTGHLEKCPWLRAAMPRILCSRFGRGLTRCQSMATLIQDLIKKNASIRLLSFRDSCWLHFKSRFLLPSSLLSWLKTTFFSPAGGKWSMCVYLLCFLFSRFTFAAIPPVFGNWQWCT